MHVQLIISTFRDGIPRNTFQRHTALLQDLIPSVVQSFHGKSRTLRALLNDYWAPFWLHQSTNFPTHKVSGFLESAPTCRESEIFSVVAEFWGIRLKFRNSYIPMFFPLLVDCKGCYLFIYLNDIRLRIHYYHTSFGFLSCAIECIFTHSELVTTDEYVTALEAPHYSTCVQF